jgi:hypothetical protein
MSTKTCQTKSANDDIISKSFITISYLNDVHFKTEINIIVRLPAILKQKYWKFHDLSKKDIENIVNFVDSKTAWLACMLEGIEVAAGSIKTSHDCAEGLLVSGKSTALKKLIKHFKAKRSLASNEDNDNTENEGDDEDSGDFEKHRITNMPKNDKIDDSDIHSPPIPRHFIGENEIRLVSQIIAPPLNANVAILIPGIYHFKNYIYVPVTTEGSGIVAHRISKIENFNIKKNTPFLFLPMLCLFEDVVYGLSDDVIRFFE